MTKARTAIAAASMAALLMTGCAFDHVVTGPMRTDEISVNAPNADHANIELDMAAGEMKVSGGAKQLIQGRAEYNVDAWKPLVTQAMNGSHAAVTIKQPAREHGGGGSTHYLWDLSFNDHALLDLTVNCGAGQANLNLGTLLLRNLEVHMGAGQVILNLRGTPTHDYEVAIKGGVGQADVHLPHGVGIWAQAHGGIGAVNVTGLKKVGDHWENDSYDKAKVTVKITVNGGIGEINIGN